MAPTSIAVQSSVPRTRLESIDIVRGLALFGVLMVNLVTEFRVSIFQQFLEPSGPQPIWDQCVEMGMAIFLSMKAFALFSLLFGVGLGIQFERLSSKGEAFYRLSRRLVILLAFGLVHLVLIWNGDILAEYAIGGLVLLPLLFAGRGVLVTATAALFVLYFMLPVIDLIPWPSHSRLVMIAAEANRTYGSGNFVEILQFRINEIADFVPLHGYVFPRTLALFGLGVLAWRSGVLSQPASCPRLLRFIAIAGLTVGFGLAIADVSGAIRTWTWLGSARSSLPNLGTTVLALGYGATLVLALQRPAMRRFLRPLAPMGRMAFTNYIVQSIVFGWIFYGYGLGQFGKLGVAVTALFGVALYATQAFASAWWLKSYDFGPLEWLWRTLTYGEKQPMRRSLKLVT